MVLRLLAIDGATKAGWAYYEDGVFTGGTWNLAKRKGEVDGDRLLHLYNHLDGFPFVGVVAYEQPGKLQGAARRVLPALQGVVELWCAYRGCEFRAYSPKEIKRYATGKGVASKDEMSRAAECKWPDIEFVDDNHVDAMWLLSLALRDLRQKRKRPVARKK